MVGFGDLDREAARQLAATAEIGQRRAQEGTWAFALVEIVAAKHGLRRESLEADKYLSD